MTFILYKDDVNLKNIKINNLNYIYYTQKYTELHRIR